jgi:hypothetical protein
MGSISKINSVSWDNISKRGNILKANIGKVGSITSPSSIPSSIVTDNLFLSYNAENTSGTTVLDQSGNGHNLQMYNGAYVSTFEGVDTFITDGVNDTIYASLSHSDFNGIDYPVTLESWHWYGSNQGYLSAFVVNDPGDTIDWFRQHVDSRTGTTNNRTWGQVYTWSGQRYTMHLETNAFSGNGWKHIVTTIDRDAGGGRHVVRHYINGTFVGEANTGTVIQYNESRFTIVPWSESSGTINVSINCLIRSSPSYYNGRVSEARFYSDKLTDAEILQNYNATKTKHGIS